METLASSCLTVQPKYTHTHTHTDIHAHTGTHTHAHVYPHILQKKEGANTSQGSTACLVLPLCSLLEPSSHPPPYPPHSCPIIQTKRLGHWDCHLSKAAWSAGSGAETADPGHSHSKVCTLSTKPDPMRHISDVYLQTKWP